MLVKRFPIQLNKRRTHGIGSHQLTRLVVNTPQGLADGGPSELARNIRPSIFKGYPFVRIFNWTHLDTKRNTSIVGVP